MDDQEVENNFLLIMKYLESNETKSNCLFCGSVLLCPSAAETQQSYLICKMFGLTDRFSLTSHQQQQILLFCSNCRLDMQGLCNMYRELEDLQIQFNDARDSVAYKIIESALEEVDNKPKDVCAIQLFNCWKSRYRNEGANAWRSDPVQVPLPLVKSEQLDTDIEDNFQRDGNCLHTHVNELETELIEMNLDETFHNLMPILKPELPLPAPRNTCQQITNTDDSENDCDESNDTEWLPEEGFDADNYVRSQPRPQHITSIEQINTALQSFMLQGVKIHSDKVDLKEFNKRQLFIKLDYLKLKMIRQSIPDIKLSRSVTRKLALSQENKISCSVCHKTFPEMYRLKLHMKFHSGPAMDRTKCDFCYKVFDDFPKAKDHMRKAHKKKPLPHPCCICGVMLQRGSRDTKLHMENHVEPASERFKCDFCPKTFRRYIYAAEHMKKDHDKSPLPVQCKSCSETFETMLLLVKHTRTTHFKLSKNFPCNTCEKSFHKQRDLKIHVARHTAEKNHKCNICGKSFLFATSRNTHLRTHDAARPRTEKCDQCPMAFFDAKKLARHKWTHSEEKPYQCELCKFSCIEKKSLRIHLANVHGVCEETSFKCSICAENFIGEKELTRHIRRVHPKEARKMKILKPKVRYAAKKKHQCDLCGKAFYSPQYLKKHKTVTHEGKKDFVCDVCGKTFAEQPNLTKHLTLHTGIYFFTCEYCPEKFNRKDTKRKHLYNKHYNEYLKNGTLFGCSACHHAFDTEDDLAEHRIAYNHQPDRWQCPFCPKILTTGVRYRTHVKFHNGENREECPICHKMIATNLPEHILRHTGERRHNCEHCGQGFIRPYELRYHIVKKHPEVEKPSNITNCAHCDKVFLRPSDLRSHMRSTHSGLAKKDAAT